MKTDPEDFTSSEVMDPLIQQFLRPAGCQGAKARQARAGKI
jgi:hypothetical protein